MWITNNAYHTLKYHKVKDPACILKNKIHTTMCYNTSGIVINNSESQEKIIKNRRETGKKEGET